MHTTLRWTACALAAAGLFLGAACGGDGDSNDVTTGPAAPSAADVTGSDQHLYNLGDSGLATSVEAANAAASARLQRYADAVAEAQAQRDAAAQAEDIERQAHLDGQARTYGP
jgi:hypothetical protein